jgi:hypothetical protein
MISEDGDLHDNPDIKAIDADELVQTVTLPYRLAYLWTFSILTIGYPCRRALANGAEGLCPQTAMTQGLRALGAHAV